MHNELRHYKPLRFGEIFIGQEVCVRSHGDLSPVCVSSDIKKDENFQDVIACGMLKADFDLGQPPQSRTASCKSQE